MTINRPLSRNVSFYDATNPVEVLGGLVQNGSITEANFLDMLGILLVVDGGTLHVQERVSGCIVSRTNAPLRTGAYDIYCDRPIQVSQEPWIHHSISPDACRGESRFCHEIRNRDRKCVISGITTFEPAYIFPPEQESLWISDSYGQLITDMNHATESSRINPSQNGFLLSSTVHQLFRQYLLSVNPDDGYKVVVFSIDAFGYYGRILDHVCRNPADPHAVSDQLLRWHFRQRVLANMRGNGEPIDTVGETLVPVGPHTQQRFEPETPARPSEDSQG
ncbi:hypothetical protein HOY82DRAFT_576493 [Tuber indicum]|nr:hypothetical protein HOY82DRAFT_576493 [Tuber indicum]